MKWSQEEHKGYFKEEDRSLVLYWHNHRVVTPMFRIYICCAVTTTAQATSRDLATLFYLFLEPLFSLEAHSVIFGL